ncbi:alpha/beta hydrolase domain-containing protein [Acrasis kona]|uniref:Alpha/beta hydrolase domain-containing protein n=1 Tax=Acrasis kona TaxID=1008807 RepID=A0AAW2Z8T8_9EUKA
MGAKLTSRILFQPPEVASYSQIYPREVEYFRTKSNIRVPFYFVESDTPSQVYVLYAHGNATDMGHSYEFICNLSQKLSVNVMHFEYYGYGILKNNSKPSEEGVYETILGAYTYLTETLRIDPRTIILMGTSMGTGAVIYLASTLAVNNVDVGGLILESPFESVVRCLSRNWFGRYIDMFPSRFRIKNVRCPILILHGTRDKVVPIKHGKEMLKLARCKVSPHWVDGAGHNNLRRKMGINKYNEVLKKFIIELYRDVNSPSLQSNNPLQVY